MIGYKAAISLWWGKMRPLFEPFARSLLANAKRIQTGRLQGRAFYGGLAQMLGIYEYPIQEVLIQRASAGSVFYDIGANNGFFTLLASIQVGQTGSVHSFEPLPKNIVKIKDVIRNNHLGNCHLEECAVTNFTGRAQLFFEDNESATPSLISERNHAAKIDVPTVSLDDYILHHPKPDFIKVDVEGAELFVLQGAEKLLSSAALPVWIIEIHHSEEMPRILALLNPARYRIQSIAKPGKAENDFPIHILALPHEES